MNGDVLLTRFTLGGQSLSNRTVMAPLTRSRADDGAMPTRLMSVYYAQRAGAGLIVSEGTVISPQGAAYPSVPGLYDDDQVRAWNEITDAVHARGGVIYAQLWHVGRQSHSSQQPDGLPPWAPSPVAITGASYYRKPKRLPYEIPRELDERGIAEIVGQYAAATRRALVAGFDGVEIHGANGYLVDQFLNSSSNVRRDRYGGGPEQRVRFLHEVIEAMATQMPSSRIGVRLSPSSTWMDAFDENKRELHSHVVSSLNRYRLAYLHLVEPEIAGSTDAEATPDDVPVADLAPLFDGPVITTGGHTPSSAERMLADGVADLVGFGRLYIANPDLSERIRTGRPLAEPDRKGFYGGGARGYVTYPTIAEEDEWRVLERSLARGDVDGDALLHSFEESSDLELAMSGRLYLKNQLSTHLASEAGAVNPTMGD